MNTTFSKPSSETQEPPGSQEQMHPKPVEEDQDYLPSGKLKGKVVIITGGDSGIGRSVAILFAKEGADICLSYLNEHEDADKTLERVIQLGQRGVKYAGDIAQPAVCEAIVRETLNQLGRIDILINNAGEQVTGNGVKDLEPSRVEAIFRTNLFSMFYLTKAVLPHLKAGAAIINTTSIQAYEPSPKLMDYAITKASILNFTRSLATELAEKQIRVNAVAPGPIWTPLIPTTFSGEELKSFGEKTLFKRAGQPAEVAPSFLFLADNGCSSFITGQVIHVNGGQGMFR
jgi:NAD(P)-dependent dehydrogenase (short-subunit alcohol dehydrogenase family)